MQSSQSSYSSSETTRKLIEDPPPFFFTSRSISHSIPRNATGAELGVVGMASYAAAGIQDVVSGALIDAGKTVVDGVTTYDFSTAAIFWIAASII